MADSGCRRGSGHRIVAAAAAVLVGLVVLLPNAARADHCTDASLVATLIGPGDLPRGYVRDAELSGRIDVQGAVGRVLTADEEAAVSQELHCGYNQAWVDDESATIVSTVVYELRSGAAAAQFLAAFLTQAARLDPTGFAVPAVSGARGFVTAVENPATGNAVGEEAIATFRRGRYVFTVIVTALTADVATARDIAARQADRAPAGESAPADAFSLPEFLGRMSGALLCFVGLYLLVVAGIARLRDRSRGSAVPRLAGPAEGVTDISSRARRERDAARLRFAAQILGLSLLLPAIVPAFWPASLLLAAVGLPLVCAPAWLNRRRREPRLFTGRRTVGVTLWFTAALVLLLAGAMLAGLTGVISARGESVLVPSSSPSGDDLEIDPTAVALPGLALAVALAAGGVGLYRRGRRLAAVDAKALMERDERPIVLYLRSFIDDNVMIRTAVSGRRSLIEQLSPGRFDRFEEVLAWELNRVGPVVALNPPGVTLAPVGAARTTLPNEGWQSTIAEWMNEAAVIVVNAPPREATDGLRWELLHIHQADLWAKTVFVCPPLDPGELRRRWAAFQPLLAGLGAPVGSLPVDPANVLAAAVTPGGGWSVAAANERSEWTYVAALRELTAQGIGAAPRFVPEAM